MSTERASMCAREINKFLHFTLGNDREELIAGIIDDYFPKRNRSHTTEIAHMEVILGKDSLNCTDMLLLRQLVQDAKRNWHRAQLLNKKAAAALAIARSHVRGNINRCNDGRDKRAWCEDEQIILTAYDELIGYSEASDRPGADSVLERDSSPAVSVPASPINNAPLSHGSLTGYNDPSSSPAPTDKERMTKDLEEKEA